MVYTSSNINILANTNTALNNYHSYILLLLLLLLLPNININVNELGFLFVFVPVVVSHTGQIYSFNRLMLAQIMLEVTDTELKLRSASQIFHEFKIIQFFNIH